MRERGKRVRYYDVRPVLAARARYLYIPSHINLLSLLGTWLGEAKGGDHRSRNTTPARQHGCLVGGEGSFSAGSERHGALGRRISR